MQYFVEAWSRLLGRVAYIYILKYYTMYISFVFFSHLLDAVPIAEVDSW